MNKQNEIAAAQLSAMEKVRDATARAVAVMGGDLKYGLRRGYWTPVRVVYLLLAVMLVVFGFAIDGSSAAGHHLGLIAGGIFCGFGLKR